MIPVEVREPSIRRQLFDLSLNKESLSVGLDLINVLRDKSKFHKAACKLRAARRYNTKVRPRSFHKGDLVWRIRSNTRKLDDKFLSNWEGLFWIREVGEGGAYHLEWLSRKIVPRTWNATHLKFYFSWTMNKMHALFPRPVAPTVGEVLKKRFRQTKCKS